MDESLSLARMQRLCEQLLAELDLPACVLLGWQAEGTLQCVYAVHQMKPADTVHALTWIIHDYARRATLPKSAKKESTPLLTQTSALLAAIDAPAYIAVCIRLDKGKYRVVYSTRKLTHPHVMTGMSWALKRYVEKNIK